MIAAPTDPCWYVASPTVRTSRMFPRLEPYTEAHKRYFETMLPKGVVMPKVREDIFILTEDFTVTWMLDDGTWLSLTIPAGFITDVASIPWLLTLLKKRDGVIRVAAIPHDLCYQLKELLVKLGIIKVWTEYKGWAVPQGLKWGKRESDKLFAKIMKAFNVKLSGLVYSGVRFGGWFAYWSNDPVRLYTVSLYGVDEKLRNSWND